MKAMATALLLCFALALAACGDSSEGSATGSDGDVPVESAIDASKRTKPQIEIGDEPPPDELVVEDLIEGSGKVAKKGDDITIEYVGVRYKNGEEYANSWVEDYPSVFEIGPSETIVGWEKGIPGMKVGGRRKIGVPPGMLGFGTSSGDTAKIDPGEGVVFVIDLLGVSKAN